MSLAQWNKASQVQDRARPKVTFRPNIRPGKKYKVTLLHRRMINEERFVDHSSGFNHIRLADYLALPTTSNCIVHPLTRPVR